MWIGVISDTCGELDARVADVFGGVDYILHCGGIGDPAILDVLSHIAPVAGVLAAHDSAAAVPFEKSLYRNWFEVGIYLAHSIGDPMELSRAAANDIEQYAPQVVLFGNQPSACNSRIDGRLFFAPGPAGPFAGATRRSVGILEIEGRNHRAESIPLDGR
jgi:predicted phosphodiesterase